MDELMFKKYAVDKSTELGHGMFGVLYKARNIITNQDVAMKHVRSVASAMEEIKVLNAAGDHDNILHMHDYHGMGNGVWMALEFCDLGDLQSYCKDNKPNIDMTVSIVHQAAMGLQYLHTRPRPIIHRDLKPGNILLKSTDDTKIVVKLADFGISKTGEQGVSSEEWLLSTDVGTQYYKAPEFWDISEQGIRYTVSVDIFALGLVLEALVHYGQRLSVSLLPAKAIQQGYGNYTVLGQLMHAKKKSINVVKYQEGESRKQVECKELITQMTQYYSGRRPKLDEVIERLGQLKDITVRTDQTVGRLSNLHLNSGDRPREHGTTPWALQLFMDSVNRTGEHGTTPGASQLFMDSGIADVKTVQGKLALCDDRVSATPHGVLPSEGVQLSEEYGIVWLTQKHGTIAVGSNQSATLTLVTSDGVILNTTRLNLSGNINSGLLLQGDIHGVITGMGTKFDTFKLQPVNIDLGKESIFVKNTLIKCAKPISMFSISKDDFGILRAGDDTACIEYRDRQTYNVKNRITIDHKDVDFRDTACVAADGTLYITSWQHGCVKHFTCDGNMIESIGTKTTDQFSDIPGLLYYPYTVLTTVNNELLVQCLDNIHIYTAYVWSMVPMFVHGAWHICCDGQYYYTVYKDKLRIHKILKTAPVLYKPGSTKYQDIKSVSCIPAITSNLRSLQSHTLREEYNTIWQTRHRRVFMLGAYNSCTVAMVTTEGDVIGETKLKVDSGDMINSGLMIHNDIHAVVTCTTGDVSKNNLVLLEIDTAGRRITQTQILDVIKPVRLFDVSRDMFGLLRWSYDEKLTHIHFYRRHDIQLVRVLNLTYPKVTKADNICMNPTGEMYIYSYLNGKVYMFTPDGVSAGCIGQKADEPYKDIPGHLFLPCAIKMDHDGGVIVMTNDGRVHRYQGETWRIVAKLDPLWEVCCVNNEVFTVRRNMFQMYRIS